MTIREQLLTHAGAILYRELPEEYRYRDTGPEGDLADLEAYLHGFGHLLDLVRGTIEQAYADAFAEETDTGLSIQPWLIPYLADLIGAELMAPDPRQRIEELNNSILWTKSKGTLRNIDQVGDVVSGAETVAREGWRLTLTCPRPALPPFSVPEDQNGVDPLGRTARPLGCPDFRLLDRAVQDPSGASPLFRLRYPARDADGVAIEDGTEVYWKPRAPGGVPCFPGRYDDGAARCPDLRDPRLHADLGPHPRRTLIHVRTPDGMFAAGLRQVQPTPAQLTAILSSPPDTAIGPAELLALLGDDRPVPDRLAVRLSKDLTLAAGTDFAFRDLLFTGRVTPPSGTPRPPRILLKDGAKLGLIRCAAEHITLEGTGAADDGPALTARDSLFSRITGPNRGAELVYCTVMDELDLARLNASDCLLADLSSNINCGASSSCIRYSRFDVPKAKKEECFGKSAPSNTDDAPAFAPRFCRDADGSCSLRLPAYGEPGYGVLATAAPASIARGAEDEGEMGAHHHLFLAAQLRALQKKLTRFLPLGQEIALLYDPLLALVPPRLTDAGN